MSKRTATGKRVAHRHARKRFTPKQVRFVAAYDGNAADAARKAGYKGTNQVLAVTGNDLLRNPKIAAAIAARENGKIKKLIATREERQEFWSTVMRACRHSMRDRLRASELLGKSECDFPNKHEHGGVGGGPVRFAGTLLTPEQLAMMTTEEIHVILSVLDRFGATPDTDDAESVES